MWFIRCRVVVPSLDVKWREIVLHCIYYHVMELLYTGFGFITGFMGRCVLSHGLH
jgi:hypothetical protein